MTIALPDHLQPAEATTTAPALRWTGIATTVAESRSARLALDGHASALCVEL